MIAFGDGAKNQYLMTQLQFLPVDTSTRALPQPDLSPTPLSTPIINLQNAPAAPDPSGLSALAQLLSNPNFEDITGLDGTQRNALEALISSFEATTAAGSMAAGLASQGINLATQLQSIKKGKREQVTISGKS